jgi:hypothetical protein
MNDTLPLRVASPDQQRAAAILDTEERRAAEARLHLLATRLAVANSTLDWLEAEWKRRVAPHESRKAELRRAIELLEVIEGEACDAIIAIDRELAPKIKDAETKAASADAEHFEAQRALRGRGQ